MLLSLQFCIILALPSCGTLIKDPVTIKDEPLYYLKEASVAQWAVAMHFLTSGSVQITKDQWDAMSEGMACMPLPSFDDFNAEISKLCSQVPCNYSTQIKAFFSRLKAASK